MSELLLSQLQLEKGFSNFLFDVFLVTKSNSHSSPNRYNIKLKNINWSVFNTIYLRNKSINYKCKCTFLILKLVFNGKDGFGGHWGDHKF